MKNLITRLFVIVLLCLTTMPIFGQSGVGKLSGKVTDAATGEPLIGANIIVVNSNQGGASDIEGQYYVLNITPGTYDVKVSYVGYASKTLTGVRIVAGITYDLNIQLTTDFSLPEVVVQGKKFFEEKSTNTTKVVDAGDIDRLPVKGVEQLASIQAGVVMSDGSGGSDGNATINVRGGRGNEVLYIVDGVAQNDVYSGANYSQVSNSAIEQLSFQIGGYEAKYGQAQSGIINVTTKAGNPTYAVYLDVLSSSFTDKYGYNLYTANLSGPFIPGNNQHTFFVSAERGWFLDSDPHSAGISFNSNVKKSSDVLENNDASVWRYTVRTNHNLGDFTVKLGANLNERKYRSFIMSYAKNNSVHNPLTKMSNYSFSGRVSQNLSSSTFWNLNLGYRIFDQRSGDGVWFDNLKAYGDRAANLALGADILTNGSRMSTDEVQIFMDYGRISNAYSHTNNNTMTADFDLTSQMSNHLFEVGGGYSYNLVRFYSIGPAALSNDANRVLADDIRFANQKPTAIGFDVTGQTKTAVGSGDYAPKTPVILYGYVQDRFELSDIVLNVGLRFDYFDSKTDVIKDLSLPYGYGNPTVYDKEDFETKKPEFYLAPRIGLGFPITATTVFHAQYGKFVQQPVLNNLYSTIFDLDYLKTSDQLQLNNGHLNSEITTQYEIGFRHVIGEVAALNITAFYKNTEGLTNLSNVYYQRVAGGQTLHYFAPTNSDFGTIKGLSLALDIARISFFTMAVDYTFSLAEGTGSSTSANYVAAFRNVNGEIPKVIAPLDFDQRHTGVVNLDFYIPKDNLGIFEQVDANVLLSFNSGRPYTPLVMQDLTVDFTQQADNRGYVNSSYGPSTFRIDIKLEKGFTFDNLIVTPYLWIENLLNTQNAISIYRSTGDPSTTGYLNTQEAQKKIASSKTPDWWKEDYKSLERNPYNFGIPRLIKLGVKVNFSNILL